MVPLRAASMLNGSAALDLAALKDGGSTRRKGEELARRPLERRPMRLCLGEPRLCEMGVMLDDVGTESERALWLMADDAGAGVVMRLNIGFAVLRGVPSKPLAFFEGDARILGSTFSESKSSKVSSENARLFDLVSVGLPTGDVASSRIEIARKCQSRAISPSIQVKTYHSGGS